MKKIVGIGYGIMAQELEKWLAMMRSFYNSHAVAALCIIGTLMVGMEAAFLVLVLAVLEISLSMDNAVVNAGVLKSMTAVWQKRFMTWGILVAVFGMRLVFPI